MTPSTLTAAAGIADGERRRDAALALLRDHRAVLVRRVQRAYLDLLLVHGPSTIDGVRPLVPIPPGTDPRLVGAAVRQLAELRLIRRAGMTRSVRPVAHRRDLAVWGIADRDVALDWLAAHPDRPDAVPDAGDARQLSLWD